MSRFDTLPLPGPPTARAPDGSAVRALLALERGSMAHFTLAPGQVARAVAHRSVEEIWYVLAGRGEMWRQADGCTEVTALTPGLCLTIPLGTRFQFRASPETALEALGVTMPPWPGAEEAYVVDGPWRPSA